MRYAIIGNGVAGVTAAFTLREREPKAEITLISGESDYFFSRTALMYALMDRMTLRDLEPYERNVYEKQKIRRVRDWVTDLDGAARRLRLRSKGEVAYDRLLIATGSRPNLFPWKGLDRIQSGLVHFVTLEDLQAVEKAIRPGGRAVVIGGGLIGVELVECLVHHGMQVTFLVLEDWYWPIAFGREEGEMVADHIRGHGVDLRVQEEAVEFHSNADGGVSHVETKAGSSYPCELLGIAVGVHPAVEWLRGVATPPRVEKGVVVSPDFRTSLEDVWAAGDCAEIRRDGEKPLIEQIWYSAKLQGEMAAKSMLGDRIDYRPPLFYNSSRFFEVDYTTVGAVNQAPEGAQSFYRRIPGKCASLRIVHHEGAVIGFNMLGSRWDHAWFEKWIAERRGLDYVLAHLHVAQFDAEFSRLKLEGVTA
ncbi:MAG: FAD-dependent oxidoreductase [Acidimicrobiia bacterium]|nr:FAD-dependent oxidoreductase [Acidimicrobiia bacterium]